MTTRIHMVPQRRHTMVLTRNLHLTHLGDMVLEPMEVKVTVIQGIQKGDEKVGNKDWYHALSKGGLDI